MVPAQTRMHERSAGTRVKTRRAWGKLFPRCLLLTTMLALRAARSLRRLTLISSTRLATASSAFQLTPGRRCFSTSQPLAKNAKGPKRSMSNSGAEIPDRKTADFLISRLVDRHTTIIKASLGIVNLDHEPYDTVISVQDVKDALVETGRLIMSTGDISSPARKMTTAYSQDPQSRSQSNGL